MVGCHAPGILSWSETPPIATMHGKSGVASKYLHVGDLDDESLILCGHFSHFVSKSVSSISHNNRNAEVITKGVTESTTAVSSEKLIMPGSHSAYNVNGT